MIHKFIRKVDQLLGRGSTGRVHALSRFKFFRDHSDARWQGSSTIGAIKVAHEAWDYEEVEHWQGVAVQRYHGVSV